MTDYRMKIEDMQFCLVPAGPFWMGSEESIDEKPLHLNEALNDDYWISRYPITNAQFAKFVKAGGYHEARYWPEAKAADVWKNGKVIGWRGDQPREQPYDFGLSFNPPNHPVVGISWYEALAFCRWLTECQQNKNWFDAKISVQLPSEAEWEKAARGGVEIPITPLIRSLASIALEPTPQITMQTNPLPQRNYPWGDQFDASLANSSETNIQSTSAVGCFPRRQSPYGCEEMSGNVWQWTRSLWGKDWQKPDFKYQYDPNDGRENLEVPLDTPRVLRGGAFLDNEKLARCAARLRYYPNGRGWFIGFRLAVLSRPASATA